ncbi:micrococcal nuclease [Azospirillaceae bacterium]
MNKATLYPPLHARTFALVWFGLFFFRPFASWAEPLVAPYSSNVVAEVVSGDEVRLADGHVVRLIGIQSPWLPRPPARQEFKAWPLAQEAKSALASLLRDHTVFLRSDGPSPDRYGRLPVHLFRDDGLWVQGELLRQGWARVQTLPNHRAMAQEMLTIESEARTTERGLWRHRFYAIRTPSPLKRDIESFQIVEGRVLATASVRDYVYLNFGSDWRTDFTVRIPKKIQRLIQARGIAPITLEGRPIRVRGWIIDHNGPEITLTHPEQIEFIEETSTK